MKLPLYVFLVLGLLVGTISCEERIYPPIPMVEFKQTLLRDAMQFLSQQSGISIKLSREVNSIDDLYVDLSPMRGQKLDKVLDAILVFIEKEHKRRLLWKEQKDGSFIVELVKELQ